MKGTITIHVHVRPTAPPWSPGSWKWEVDLQVDGDGGNITRNRELAVYGAEAFIAQLDAGPAVIVRHYRKRPA